MPALFIGLTISEFRSMQSGWNLECCSTIPACFLNHVRGVKFTVRVTHACAYANGLVFAIIVERFLQDQLDWVAHYKVAQVYDLLDFYS